MPFFEITENNLNIYKGLDIARRASSYDNKYQSSSLRGCANNQINLNISQKIKKIKGYMINTPNGIIGKLASSPIILKLDWDIIKDYKRGVFIPTCLNRTPKKFAWGVI